jgi:hypothetical protein
LFLFERPIRFRKAEGLDLMLRCLREKKLSALGAVRAVNSATANNPNNCEKVGHARGGPRGWGRMMMRKMIMTSGSMMMVLVYVRNVIPVMRMHL